MMKLNESKWKQVKHLMNHQIDDWKKIKSSMVCCMKALITFRRLALSRTPAGILYVNFKLVFLIDAQV